jgi:transposase
MRFGGGVIQRTKDRGAGRFRFWYLGTAAERLGEGVAVFGIGPATRIYLALGATDMRKGFEGLYGLVRDRLQLEPLSGHVFLFCNKARNRTKILFWDGSGLWICAKRLEKGRFSWPSEDDQQTRIILSHEELALLLGGIEVGRTRRKDWYRKELELSDKM